VEKRTQNQILNDLILTEEDLSIYRSVRLIQKHYRKNQDKSIHHQHWALSSKLQN
jgi:hypothetical protein